MIVLDEQLADERIVAAIQQWYPGRVAVINELAGPQRVIADEAIPGLLYAWKGCTFVTINVRHFWRRTGGHPRYAVLCLDLPAARALAIPSILRRVLRLAAFRTQASRCGRIVLVSSTVARYYEALSDPETVVPLAESEGP